MGFMLSYIRKYYMPYNETLAKQETIVNKKLAIAIVFAPLAIELAISLTKDYVQHRASQKELQTEIDARNYATSTVLKMYLDDKIKSNEDYEREFQFAYLAYRYYR